METAMDQFAIQNSAEDQKVYRSWRSATVAVYCALVLLGAAFLGFRAWTTPASPVQAATQSQERPAERHRSWPSAVDHDRVVPRQAAL
jgi:hypothetical protein